MAAPAFDEAIPLFWLQDGHAPYKGIWMFQQTLQGRVEATHCTFSHEHGPACVIENWQFELREAARQFIDHLLIHGWGILELQPAGESLLSLPTPRS